MVRVAVEGCCHGSLNAIYQATPKYVELLLICGDFQAFRNRADLHSFSAPEKYRTMMDFHDYYSGKRTAPVLTVFIGGNHEASSHLRELQFGGWVAPNIYYLGEYGTVWCKGLRISGTSGIFNHASFVGNHTYALPYDRSAIRSVYHVKPKNFVKQLLTGHADIVLSHDWPQWIWEHGDWKGLLRRKKHLSSDMKSGRLGSPVAMEALKHLRPRHWFSSHLHTRFTAEYKHRSKRRLSGGDVPRGEKTVLDETGGGPLETKMGPKIELSDTKMGPSDTKMEPLEDEGEIPVNMDSDGAANESEKNSDSGEIAVDMDSNDNFEDSEGAIAQSGEIDLDMDSEHISTKTKGHSEIPHQPSVRLMQDTSRLIASGSSQKSTSFLALDKCLPKRRFLEVIDIQSDSSNSEPGLYYDPRAIAIHRAVESAAQTPQWAALDPRQMLSAASLSPLLHELEVTVQMELSRVSGDLRIPQNFRVIAPTSAEPEPEVKYWPNNQTAEFCRRFQVPEPSLE